LGAQQAISTAMDRQKKIKTAIVIMAEAFISGEVETAIAQP
jgi:hypothetical protein